MKKIKINPIKINKYEFEYPIFAASLAGYSDKSYRKILKESKVPLVFTEMISSKALIFNNIKTLKMINILNEKKPIGVQIFGKDPFVIAKAAKIAVEKGADIIDFNMACPVNKIINNGEGAALIEKPYLSMKILEKLVNSVKIPITLKIRKSLKKKGENSIKIIKMAEEIGIKAIFIHARSCEERHKGLVDWEYIRKIKNISKIPIIGNGDITTPEKAKEIFDNSYCDGILIGRGFIGNPIFYKNCIDFFNTGKYKVLNSKEKIKWMKKHFEYILKDKGEEIAVKEIRKYSKYYLKGILNNINYRNKINNSFNKIEIYNILNNI